jgi:hypothetical protein
MRATRPLPASLALALAAALLPAARAAESSVPTITARTNLIATVVTERRSVFEPDAPGAKDPFFPQAARQTRNAPATQLAPQAIFPQLSLRGIISGRSAIVNNRRFVKGEELTVSLPDGATTKIKVHEITDTSVTLTINGGQERHQLRARGAAR